MAEPPPPTAPDIRPRQRSGKGFRADRVRGRHDAADEHALHEAEREKDRGGDPADLRHRGQQAEGRRRQADADHRHHQGAAATETVGIGAEERGTVGADQQRHAEGRVGAGERQHRLVGRKEQPAHDRRHVEQDEEIEEIEPPPEERGRTGGGDLPVRRLSRGHRRPALSWRSSFPPHGAAQFQDMRRRYPDAVRPGFAAFGRRCAAVDRRQRAGGVGYGRTRSGPAEGWDSASRGRPSHPRGNRPTAAGGYSNGLRARWRSPRWRSRCRSAASWRCAGPAARKPGARLPARPRSSRGRHPARSRWRCPSRAPDGPGCAATA